MYWVLVVYYRLRLNINLPSSSVFSWLHFSNWAKTTLDKRKWHNITPDAMVIRISLLCMKHEETFPPCLSRTHTQCRVWWCLACGPVRSRIILQNYFIENYFILHPAFRLPRYRTTTSQLQKGRLGGAAFVIECGWVGVSATSRHDVTFCQKTHRLGSWRDCLIVFCSMYLLLGVWRWLGWLSVAKSECMCVLSKRASRQEMTCPIVVGLDTAWFASSHVSLATHCLHLALLRNTVYPLQH